MKTALSVIASFLLGSLLLWDVREAHAQVTLDGDLQEWTKFDRVDLAPNSGAAGDAIYSRADGATYVLAIRSPALTPGARFTIWMNTDGNPATGYQVFGFAGGAEFNLSGTVGGETSLYSGAAGQQLVSRAVPSASKSGSIEIALPRSAIPGSPASFEILVDVNNQRYIPLDFSQIRYVIPGDARPVRTTVAKRIAIFYSDTTAKRFFDRKAYALLFASAQTQAVMAGIPFDLLDETDILNLAKLAQYDALIFPLVSHIPTANVSQIRHNLHELSYRYGIGFIASGDFITNDELGNPLAGDPYRTTKEVLGITPSASGQGAASLTLLADEVSHPVMRGYLQGEVIRDYPNGWFRTFDAFGGNVLVRLVSQRLNSATFAAVTAGITGGRNVHFSTERSLGDTNVLWSAIRWVALGAENRITLRPTRFAGLSLFRFDGFGAGAERAAAIEQLRSLGSEGVRGTAYLKAAETSQIEAGTILNAGFDIGLLPVTPLNAAPGEFEQLVGQEKTALQTFSGVPVTSAALPTTNVPLDQTLRLGVAFTSVSGEPSVLGQGYPQAFGLLSPRSPVVYAAPNFVPGRDTIASLLLRASAPILHRAITGAELLDATKPIRGELAAFSNLGLESVTMGELMARLRAQRAASLVENVITPDVIDVRISGNGLGISALECGRTISSVDGWYAFSGDRIFLPELGGNYTVRFSGAPAPSVRITSLPPGARLISVEGDGSFLRFVLTGEGEIRVSVPPIAGTRYDMIGAATRRMVGDELVGTIEGSEIHEIVVASSVCGDGAVFAGELCDDGNLSPGDGCSATCGIESDFACGGEPSVCAISFDTVKLSPVAGESGWVGSDRLLAITKRQNKELKVGDDARNRSFRAILSFDTSNVQGDLAGGRLVLPLTRPLSAKVAKLLGGLTADLKSGAFGKSAALEVADFKVAPSAKKAGRLDGLTSGARLLEIPLSAQALAMVNREGRTQLRVSGLSRKSGKDGLAALFKIPLSNAPYLELRIR